MFDVQPEPPFPTLTICAEVFARSDLHRYASVSATHLRAR